MMFNKFFVGNVYQECGLAKRLTAVVAFGVAAVTSTDVVSAARSNASAVRTVETYAAGLAPT